MVVQKNIKTTTYKYDEGGNVTDVKVVEEVEFPNAESKDSCKEFDAELVAEQEFDPVEILFGLAGILSVITMGVSLMKTLRK